MSPGARLRPLLTGELLAPPQLLRRVRGPESWAQLRALGLGVRRRDRVWIPVPAFLVEHPERGPLLIDTGIPELALSDQRAAMGPVAVRLYGLRVASGQPVRARLRALGIDPGAVREIVMTHLHFDHAAAARELAHATLLADAREWEVASARAAITAGYHRPHVAHARRRALDVAAGEPWAGFDRTLDLFGDGTVRLLSTPGHTPGHLSVAVRLAGGGHVLVAADLAYTMETVSGAAEPGLCADRGALRDSLRQLRAHVAAHPDTIVIPGHDPAAWPTLEEVYA